MVAYYPNINLSATHLAQSFAFSSLDDSLRADYMHHLYLGNRRICQRCVYHICIFDSHRPYQLDQEQTFVEKAASGKYRQCIGNAFYKLVLHSLVPADDMEAIVYADCFLF